MKPPTDSATPGYLTMQGNYLDMQQATDDDNSAASPEHVSVNIDNGNYADQVRPQQPPRDPKEKRPMKRVDPGLDIAVPGAEDEVEPPEQSPLINGVEHWPKPGRAPEPEFPSEAPPNYNSVMADEITML